MRLSIFKLYNLFYLIICMFVHFCHGDDQGTVPPNFSDNLLARAQEEVLKSMNDKNSADKLDNCKVCRFLVDSFKNGLKKTSRNKFDGGDALWEESRLRSYKDSEVRLVEIQELLCSDVSTGKDECHLMAEKHEPELEAWWFKERLKTDLIDYLCIKKLKHCCPDNQVGKECMPCPGHPGPICSGHGACLGTGSRFGTGLCNCSLGYTGPVCTDCADGYFQSKTESAICESCHSSCAGHCRGKSPKDCEVCRQGHIWDPSYGCLDVNECLELEQNPCRGNTFCVNTEGSYQCFPCDKGCEGCHGDGPDMCTKCASNYRMESDVCISTVRQERESKVETTRYVTYLGLCISTCIIFRRNIMAASVIGLLVAMYIGLAEYTVRESPSPNPFSGITKNIFGAA